MGENGRLPNHGALEKNIGNWANWSKLIMPSFFVLNYEYDEKDRKVLITLPDDTKIVNKIKIENGLIVSETIDQKNVKTR